jgi:hypothetical protein
MADRQGFEYEEMQAALSRCQNKSKEALQFLTSEWKKLVEVIIASSRAEGQKSEQNDIGDISPEEARQALQENKGDMGAAVRACVTKRKELVSLVVVFFFVACLLDFIMQENQT